MLKEKNLLAANFQISAVTQFAAAESNPNENFYLFTYKICIKNNGRTSAQLMSRHWIITDASGLTEEVRGAGVVGEQPKIEPGAIFEYESACPLMTSSGSMRGSYQMQTASGEFFDVLIPEFFLVAPQALH